MIPRTIPAKYRKHILHFDDERDMGNGYIVTLTGLTVDPMLPTHVFGEDTLRDVVNTLSGCEPCNCGECSA